MIVKSCKVTPRSFLHRYFLSKPVSVYFRTHEERMAAINDLHCPMLNKLIVKTLEIFLTYDYLTPYPG